jgi:hypothetical protein
VRRMLAGLLSLLMVLVMASSGFAAENSIRVLVDGTELQFDAEPFMENSRTLVPVRALAEKLGFVVGWDEADQRVTLTKGETVIQLWIGSTKVVVNGKESQIDVAPTKVNDRTFVPVRFVSEQLGTYVAWDNETQSVKVSSGQGLLEQLSKQQNQKTDMKSTMDMQLVMTMSNAAAPGASITMTMPMHMDTHMYQNNMLMSTTIDMGAALPGMEKMTMLQALKDGVMYMQDPTTQQWQEIGKFDLSGELPTGNFGGLDMTQLMKLSESMMKDVDVTIGGVEVLNGVSVVRMDMDMSKLNLNEFLSQFTALSGMPAELELDMQIDRLVMTSWINPATGHAPKSTMDLAMKMTLPMEDGQSMTMTMTMIGTTLSEQVSEPIVWPAGL